MNITKAIAIVSLLLISIAHTATALTLTSPITRAIYQRNDQNTALIPIEGTYTETPLTIQVRATVKTGYPGTPVDWQNISSVENGVFSGTLELQAGGWYDIEVLATTDELSEIIVDVKRIGVGEVFIAAGQSNSANYGSPAYTPTHLNSSAWTGTEWTTAADPLPIAGGTGGSPWSRLIDILIDEFDVPIGFVSVGVGGTRVERWGPSAEDLYPLIQDAIQDMTPYGFRAILWHQGESDALDYPTYTDSITYATRLHEVIEQSRIDAGCDVPWGIANAAWMPYERQEELWRQSIRQGQVYTVLSHPLNYLGPDTDVWGEEYRHDTIHFNEAGLLLHAQAWLPIIKQIMHPYDNDQDLDVDINEFATFAANYDIDTTNLAVYYPLNQISGTTATDYSGNSRTGTFVNDPYWDMGIKSEALYLDGVEDYLQITGYTGISAGSSRTCAAWINTPKTERTIISWGTAATGQKWIIMINSDGQLTVKVGGGQITGTAILNDRYWHHIAVVLDDDGTPDISELQLYVDGQPEIISDSTACTIDTGTDTDVHIGVLSLNGTGFYKGWLDEIRIYDAALSPEEILQLVNPAGDFDLSGIVNIDDFALFASHWLQ